MQQPTTCYPIQCKPRVHLEANRDTANGDETPLLICRYWYTDYCVEDEGYQTYEAVVLATNRVGTARAATNTDDADWAASETDLGGHVLDDNAQKGEDAGSGGRVSLKSFIV